MTHSLHSTGTELPGVWCCRCGAKGDPSWFSRDEPCGGRMGRDHLVTCGTEFDRAQARERTMVEQVTQTMFGHPKDCAVCR